MIQKDRSAEISIIRYEDLQNIANLHLEDYED